jgi:Ni/Fe-hydrogenase 1 B-type cytochrome subunit
MATTLEGLRDKRSVPGPIYVFNAGIRAWHWIHAIALVVLMTTGYFIANPLPSMTGEASDYFVMGYMRMAHFIAGYTFAIGLATRTYIAIVGNEWSRELFVVPFWKAEWWKRVVHEIKFYLFLTRKMSKNPGHNPLAQVFMWLINVILATFMVCTGFALYSQGTGAGSWADRVFGWVFVIEPSSQTVRMWHLMGMWVTLLFVIVHIYMVFRAEFMSRQNGISVMINGWRTFKDDGPMDPQ